jgi:hypothetical protein
MTRRIIAALIALGLNGGDYSPADGVADDSGDDDGGDRPHVFLPPAGPTARRPGVGGTRLVDRRVLPPVLVSSPRPAVGKISFNAPIGGTDLEDVLFAALAVCRERGDLKVQVVPGPCNIAEVRRACEQHGFSYSRHRSADGRPAVEFYTDLYFHPRAAEQSGDGPADN